MLHFHSVFLTFHSITCSNLTGHISFLWLCLCFGIEMFVCISIVSAEEQRDDQQDHTAKPRRTRPPRENVRVLAVLPVVAAVALAAKLCAEPVLLRLVQLAVDLRPPAVSADVVGEGVQVQVDVAVRVSAQAAAVESAQSLAALLRCRGDVEEVLTEGVLQIHRQVDAAGLGGQQRKESAQKENRERSRMDNV